MTKVLLVCSKDGCFKSLRAEGHAGYGKKGSDIVCSAESLLLYSAMDLLHNSQGILFKEDACVRGSLAFSAQIDGLAKDKESLRIRLKCTADFIRSAFKKLVADYPAFVQMREITEESSPDLYSAED